MLITILIFLAIISILVFVHELGHFVSARRAGVKVEEFGFGFPPRLFGYKKGETVYSVNLIPIGGFVKIKGESGDSRGDDDSFGHKSYWKRMVILSSGVGMNIALAFVLISIGYMFGLPTVVDDSQQANGKLRNEKIQIAYVYQDSAAAKSGLQAGDTVVGINGEEFQEVAVMQDYIKTHQNEMLQIEVSRGQERKRVEIVPAAMAGGQEKVLGVSLAKTAIISYNPLLAVYHGLVTTFSVLWQIIVALYSIIRSIFVGINVSDQLSGPIGVAVLTAQVTKLGLIYILQFTALLSLNLAIINILPFPALDGGRVLFVLIEKLRGKPNNERLESIFHNVGFSLLMVLIVFITYKDLLKYGQQIVNSFKSVF